MSLTLTYFLRASGAAMQPTGLAKTPPPALDHTKRGVIPHRHPGGAASMFPGDANPHEQAPPALGCRLPPAPWRWNAWFLFLGSDASFVDLVRGCSDGAPPADPRLLGSLEKRKKKNEK